MATNDSQISPAPQGRRLLTKQKLRKILAEQQASGLKQTEFCRQKGIPPHRLTWWKRQILIRDGKVSPQAKPRGKRSAKRTSEKVALVPVRISTEKAPTSTADSFELVFRGVDRVLRIPQDFDEEKLVSLLGVLHKTC
jgi:hypothetical protein